MILQRLEGTVVALAVMVMSACYVDDEVGLGTTSSALTSDIIHMQILAHEDDDFLFMNPDLANVIASGHGIVSVYLTAGQSAGAAATPWTPEMCAAEFAAARQRGIKAAYAQMAGLANPQNAVWWRDLIVPDAGVAWPHTVERYTLAALPQVRLIFMNIPDGGAAIGNCEYSTYTYALSRMFENPAYVTDTIVPDYCGNPSYAEGYGAQWTNCGEYWYENPFVCNVFQYCSDNVPWQNYDHAGVVNVVRGLVDMYQPYVVRTLDPRPFSKLGPPSNPCPVSGYDLCFDNADHAATAQFVDEVLAGYHGPNATGRFSQLNYIGYSAGDFPNNVGLGAYNTKASLGSTYANYGPDGNYLSSNYDTHYHTQYERYPGSTTWLEKTSNGKLVAVAVQDRQLKMWYEANGGSWAGPVNLGSNAVIAGTTARTSPHVTLVRRPDGKLQIFALRVPTAPGSPSDIITSVQLAGGTPSFGTWTSLGAPDSGLFMGPPTAAYDGFGRTFVFAKNSSGKLVYRYQLNNVWSAWAEVWPGMADIMDGIAAITKDDGLVDVYVTLRNCVGGNCTQGSIARLFQINSGFLRDNDIAFNTAASAPTAAKNQDGRIEIFYREALQAGDTSKYGRVLTAWRDTTGWWAGPTVLYGDAGTGPIAAIRRGGTGHIMIFQRNYASGVSFTRQQAPNDIFIVQWQLFSGRLIDEYPAATTDSQGRVVVIAKGTDGKLYIRRETSSSAVGNFGAWTQVGN